LVSDDCSKWVDEKGWHNCIVSMPGLSNKEIVAWCDIARKKFYLRPSYVASKFIQIIKQPQELPRLLKASRTFLKYLAKK
ncbi:MAG: radical SAM protein, partial [Candidatus ainarchaeum sp.]|nr:radical SAM protein [Candidatus ainarchaeum sp.]